MMKENESKGMDRRAFIKAGGAGTLALTMAAAGLPGDLFESRVQAEEISEKLEGPRLSFNSNGKFKVVQFNDTQDDERIDRRTI
ncbi:twin-arginine translocation signal domain-containing protein, partial [Escherichia coli]|nr:twin-arginine translocation signal domain-containing protein [Escherichia coli]